MLILLAACARDGLVELDYCTTEVGDPPTTPTADAVTWYADVEPILREHCAGCHAEGEAAPFPLETWAQTAAVDTAVRAAVLSGDMPPWSAEDCCGKEYRDDRRLTEAERNIVVGWIDQGSPEGNPEDAQSFEEPGGLARVDLELVMEPYTASPRNGTDDEVRCFLIEVPEAAEGRFVTGYGVAPGDPRIVHHVIVDQVAKKDLPTFEAYDRGDAGPGWDCYGGGGTGTGGNIGGWVPGQDALELPEGLGIELGEGSRVLLNVHYDLGSVAGEPTEDATTVQLMLEDGVEHEVQGFGMLHPLWLYDSGMELEGEGAETGYGFAYAPSAIYGRKTWTVWGAFFHMHELGFRGSMAILRGEEQECLLHIDDWDFEWQANYWFEEPTKLEPGDELYVECRWTNPGDPVAWETDQEMCAGVVYVTEDP